MDEDLGEIENVDERDEPTPSVKDLVAVWTARPDLQRITQSGALNINGEPPD